MWVFDRSTLSFLEVNDAAVAHYCYSHDEFRRMRIAELRPAGDVPRLISYMQNRPTGLQGAGEWQHVTKTGRRIDVEITSYPLDFQQRAAVLVVARDITESKRAERSEEHTSELQSLMRIPYAVFCLKKKTNTQKL